VLTIELSKQALNLLPEANSFSHCFALLDQGVTFSLNGELEKAIDTLQETIRISQASGNWIVMMIARSNLGDVLINRGELAMTLFKQSLAFAAPANGKSTGFEGLLYIEMGEIYLIRNQLTEASESLQRGVALSSAWLPMLYELDAHLHLAHLLHSQGDYAGSITQIRQAREIAEISQGSLDDLVLDAFEAKFSLLRGETSPALNWAQKNHLLDPAAANLFNNVPPPPPPPIS